MGILDEDVVRVRESTDIIALIGEQLALKRVGTRYRGLCPFHQEKTPSFYVNPELGLYKCFAGETGVITWDGVFAIRELAGTTQRILTEKGRWVDAPFRSFGVQKLWRLRVGRNRVEKDIFATREHTWFVRSQKGTRREVETWALKPGDALSWSFPTRRFALGVRPSPFGVAHGIVFGDGTRMNKGSVVDLIGEKNAELLKWFPWNHSTDHAYTSSSGTEVECTRVWDLPAYFKVRPSLDEAPSYLLGWLSGYFAADGCVAKDGTLILNSTDREDLEFVRQVCTRLGVGTYGITEQRRRGLPDREESSIYRIHLINEDLFDDFFLLREHRIRFAGTEKKWHRRGWVVREVEETQRVEEVFCATVPDTHSFALEDNILTGNCFGCQASGDAITFVREMEHLDFVEAVERLAGKAGITLRYDDKRTGENKSRNAKLAEAVGAAIDEYHRLLLESPEAGSARRYLRSRGFDGDAVRRFKLGWAPDEWDQVSRTLQQKGFKRDDLVGAGLAFVNRANKLQDQFRARLMFPIYDTRGEPAGFGGRALGDQMPKYKNSPDNPLYHKSRILYGLNWAKAEIVARGEVIVCEGYTDVMAFALAGAPNAVATCGTALTDDHVRALKNLARRVVLAYDADAAGQGAAEKWYSWESEYEIELRVAALPAGRDPAEVWQESPDALLQAVERATPFLQFRLDRLFAAADLTTPEGRGRAGQAAAAIVAQHPNDLVRDQYVMQLALRLEIEADALRQAVATAVARPEPRPNPREAPRRRYDNDGDASSAEDAPRVAAPAKPIDRREMDLLRWAIHEPEMVADWIDAALFADPQAHAVYELLATSHTFHDALDASEGPTRDLLERLAVEEPALDDEPETIAARLLVNAAEPRGREVLQQLLDAGDDHASEVKLLLDEVAHDREMGDWGQARAAALRLVAWVTRPPEPGVGT